jgi:hypothetical protein
VSDEPSVPGETPLSRPAEAARVAFAPSTALVAGLLVGGVVAAALAVALSNPGRLLFVAVAAVLLVEGCRLMIVRPTISADSSGISLHRLAGKRVYSWPEVAAVTAGESRRVIGVPTLELDLGEALVVIASYRLGAAPADVAAAIETLRPSGV